MWYIPIMGYHSAVKRKEILTHATTWMGLEDIMLSVISQSQRYKYWISSLWVATSFWKEIHRRVKFMGTENQMVARGWRGGEMESCLVGIKDFPGVQWLRYHTAMAGGMVWSPGRGIKILHVSWPPQNRRDVEFQFSKMKSSEDRLYNNVNIHCWTIHCILLTYTLRNG